MLECQYCNETFGNKGGLGIHEKHCMDNPESDYRSRCKECGDIIHSSKDFCGESCANGYNSRGRELSEDHKSKISEKLKTQKLWQEKGKNSSLYSECVSCNKKFDSEGRSEYCNECFNYTGRRELYKGFGFLEDGNLKKANKKLKKFLYKEYIVKEKSTYKLEKEYGVHNYSINSFLKNEGIKVRNSSEALSLAVENGNIGFFEGGCFDQGLHETWIGREVFLRSSYEKKFAEKLDKKKIDYDVESKSFSYKDKNGDSRKYIPDFYLPEYKMIIEIKSEYTLEREEYTDKKVKSVENSDYEFEMLIGLKDIKNFFDQ